MRAKYVLGGLAAAAVSWIASIPGAVADTPAEFYRGKTIRIIVGFGPGGGYDLYARTFARFMPKNMAGQPTVVVENMDGAGSVRATNYVYGVAPKDGTVLGATNQNMPMYQLLGGKEARFDTAKFNWLGTQAWSNGLVYTWHSAGIKTLDDAKKREVTVGGVGISSDSFIYPTIINHLTGTKFKVITGYKGSSEIHLALERGEVEARGGNSWASLASSNPEWLKDGKVDLLVQVGLEKETELPNVPLLLDLVTTDEGRQIARLVSLPIAVGYTIFAAPEVPADRVAALRAAFDATMKDLEFLADAAKRQMLIKPRSGAEVAKLVASVKDTPPSVLKKTAEILGWSD